MLLRDYRDIAMSQSQASQFCDTHSSFIDDASFFETLQLPPSDDFLPDLLFSQPTYSVAPSISDSNPTSFPAQLPPAIPPCLEQISLYHERKTRTYVVFEMGKDSNLFVAWWLQTDFGRSKRIRWDAPQQSPAWQGFKQVADAEDGTPKVLCTACRAVQEHPKAGGGLSTMTRHRTGAGCKRSTKNSTIKQFIQPVMPALFYYLLAYLLTLYY
jgi:hypothetical protein